MPTEKPKAFAQSESGEVRHLIAEVVGSGQRTLCGVTLAGERVTADDAPVCGRCEGRAG